MLLSATGTLVPSMSGLSDRTPVLGSGSYYSTSSLPLSGQWAAYSAIYRRQLWVNTLVSKLAMAHSRTPFGFRVPDGKGGYTQEDGDLAALMRNPNKRMSGNKFWIWFSSTYDVYGEVGVLKLRDLRGKVRELWPLHPENIRIETDENGDLWYVKTNGAAGPNGFPRFHESDVIWQASYNPETTTRGVSKLEPLRMTLLNEDASRRATASFWQRGARPSLMLATEKTLSEGAIKRIKQQVDANAAGADNAGSSLVLEEGLKPELTQLNLEEMQYIESRKLNREEACAAYDVPPPVVHILDRATFSNITEQLRSLYRDTMAPRNVMFESTIDQQLVIDFYPTDSGVASRFDMDEVLRGDFEKRAESVGTLIEKGVMKPKEARPLFGLDDAGEVANQLFANAALVPLGSNARTPQPIATDGTLIPQPLELAASPAPKALTVRTLMGRLSQAKAAGKKATRDKLVREHEKALGEFFAKQKADVLGQLTKAGGIFTPAAWDDELAGILDALSTATTVAIGSATAAELGGKFDPKPIAEWLATDARTSAENLNAATADLIKKRQAQVVEDDDLELDDAIADLFDVAIASRAEEISQTRVGMLAGFAALVAAGQAGASTKTWVVTSGNPRASHAAVDGETVALNETFSNGMNGPGDFTGGADEVAGCTCELQFEFKE